MPADGTLEWTKLIGGSSTDAIFSMTTGSDGSIYVGGGLILIHSMDKLMPVLLTDF